MVVCKFFAQGYCRYGENCRFEHQRSGYGGGGGGGGGRGDGAGRKSVSFHDSFGQNQNPYRWLAPGQQQSNQHGQRQAQFGTMNKEPTPQEVIDQISTEMAVWESSKMWPFSCYTYAKEEASIAGFSDVSPEELRLEGYQAKANDTWPAYQRKVSDLAQEYSSKRQALRKPDLHTKQRLFQEIQNAKKKSTSVSGFGSSGGVFGATQSSVMTQNIFGSAGGSGGGGGGIQNQSSPFASGGVDGQVSAAFASTSGIFGGGGGGGGGGGAGVAQGMGLFGKSNPGLSGAVASPGLFGKAPGSVFGSPAAGGSSNVNNSVGLFGKPSTGTGLFGSSNQNQGLFGGSSGQGQSVFGGGQPSFGGATVAPGFAQQAQPTQTLPQPTQSASLQPSAGFGSPLSQQTQSVGAQQTQSAPQIAGDAGPHQTRYTPFQQLTDQEKEQFTAAKFSLGKIPTRPPPKELCL